jgi:Fic family protein
MKIPLSPPSLDDLLKGNQDQLLKIFTHRATPAPDGSYRHWDKLRHLTPPDGLTTEQWWFAVKYARRSIYREVPLRDKTGVPFVYGMPDPLLAALHQIDSRASGRISLPEAVTNDESRDRFLVSSLIEEAITSSQLEGASTTRQAAVQMLRENRRPKDKSEQMIVNNFAAMRKIVSLRAEPLSIDLILHLHSMLTTDTLDDPSAAGRFQRPGEERVRVVDHTKAAVLHEPPPAEELPKRVQALVNFANSTERDGGFVHPIVRAIILHFWLAYDHPFLDGNGRVARALFYWAAARYGYWLLEYTSISRIIKQAPARYARAFLYTETDDNDLTYFIVDQVAVIERAIASLEEHLSRKSEQVRRITEILHDQSSLSHRQIALLSHAVRHPGHKYTIRSHRTSHRVAYDTARADLLSLAKAGLLEIRQLDKKTLIFVAPQDIESRLRALSASS